MNTYERENENNLPKASDHTPKKTIYDGVKLTKRSLDIVIAIISAVLFLLFALALSRS